MIKQRGGFWWPIDDVLPHKIQKSLLRFISNVIIYNMLFSPNILPHSGHITPILFRSAYCVNTNEQLRKHIYKHTYKRKYISTAMFESDQIFIKAEHVETI